MQNVEEPIRIEQSDSQIQQVSGDPPSGPRRPAEVAWLRLKQTVLVQRLDKSSQFIGGKRGSEFFFRPFLDHFHGSRAVKLPDDEFFGLSKTKELAAQAILNYERRRSEERRVGKECRFRM